jgi:SAM-dependent methyltransferase
MSEAWEREAENWVRWARAPGHDAYWDYSPAFFDELLPGAGRRTLEVGCGEGRVSRDLARRGHRVVGVDTSPTLLRYAAAADPAGSYVRADAAALPLRDAAFDLVVAYNSLMDVERLDDAVREAARVLEIGGSLCASVTHPVNDAGAFDGSDDDAGFVISGSYLGRRPFHGVFERNGLTMTFAGWAGSLETYTRAMERAGFIIETMREPAYPAAAASSRGEERWRRIPLFLQWRAVRRSAQL